MKTVWVLVPQGVLDSSLSITLDLLRVAQSLLAPSKSPLRFDFRVLGATKTVRTGGGLTLRADETFALAAGEPDWVVVPALGEFGSQLTAHLGARDAVQAQALLRKLAARRKCHIAASCASVFLLANAGLLDGRNATTTWWLADDFRQRFPSVLLDEARMVVRDGRLLTAGSAFAQLDLMLALLTDLAGPRIAQACASYMVIDRCPSQARYMMAAHSRRHDPVVMRAERWIDEHLGRGVTVASLAQQLAVSEKTLSRRVQAATGLSPIRFVQRRRVLMATHLIETTKLPIEEVAARVGYRDSAALRRLIRRELDTRPSALR
jgi:transcriptional regulator GlxA family with amidase domain